jgi:hypothetical protein
VSLITSTTRRRISHQYQRRDAASSTPFTGLAEQRPHFHAGPTPVEGSPFRIEISSESKEAEVWLDAIEPFLPATLRRRKLGTQEQDRSHGNLCRDVSHWLFQAHQKADLDLLSYLGAESRWDVVAWVVKVVAEGYQASDPSSKQVRMAYSKHWPKVPFDVLTDTAILLNRPVDPLSRPFDLDSSLAVECIPVSQLHDIQKKGIGQIWNSLGHLVLKAAVSSAEESSKTMPHVLTIIATLHHHDIVPDSVYRHPAVQDVSAIQQPPTLHLLSSRILGALSEAEWNSYQLASAQDTQKSKSAYSFLRTELPGTRYKTQVGELRPEIWLDFVLWSCLHGGWVAAGAAILSSMQTYSGESAWSLISWSQVMKTTNTNSEGDSSFRWTDLIDIMEGAGPQPRDQSHPNRHRQIERTVSSELVSAYVDSLLDLIHIGVGEQGMPVDEVLSHVKGLKHLLDAKNFGLGYSTWDAVIQRFVESEGISVERDPELMLEILSLAQPYDTEISCANVPTEDDNIHPTPQYTLEASAIVLGLYHRVMQGYIDIGSVDGAFNTFQKLQRFTDFNQQRSIEQFFKVGQATSPDTMFQAPTGFSNLEYPSFFPRVPSYVLAPLLDLLTDSHISNFQKWLVSSKDWDGPIISRTSYAEPALAPALIRFATIFREKALLEEVIKAQSVIGEAQGFRIPRPVLSALIEAQIHRHRWDHVHKLLMTTGEKLANAVWHPPLVTAVAKEIILLQKKVLGKHSEQDIESLEQATEIFQLVYEKAYGSSIERRGAYQAREVLHSIIGVLSSINSEWATLCIGLSRTGGNQPLSMPIKEFNTILEGVVNVFGAEAGRRLWETWCVDITKNPIMPKGGIAKVPAEFVSRSDDYFDVNNRVLLPDLPGGPLGFYGRIRPTFSTLRIILRKLLLQGEEFAGIGDTNEETEHSVPHTEHGEMTEWAWANFRALGLRDKEVEKEILRLETWVRHKNT